jgi:hypothetical protein
MEEICSSRTSVGFQWVHRWPIPKDRTLWSIVSLTEMYKLMATGSQLVSSLNLPFAKERCRNSLGGVSNCWYASTQIRLNGLS